EIIEISDRIRFSLNTLVLHPQYAEATIPGPSVLLDDVPVHHVLSFTAPNEFIRVALEQPFRVQTFAIQGGQIIDRLNDENGERGLEFVLEDPSFPHCAPRGTGVPGQTVPVEIEKLRPNAPIHGLLGPELVFTGSADTQGGGVLTCRFRRTPDLVSIWSRLAWTTPRSLPTACWKWKIDRVRQPGRQ